MRRLINDDALFNRLLHHPLIGSLYRTRAVQGKPPSYVAARNFALAIADVVVTRADASRMAKPAPGHNLPHRAQE